MNTVDLRDACQLDMCVKFVESIYGTVYQPLAIFDHALFPKTHFDVEMFEPELSLGISKVFTMTDANGQIIGLLELADCSLLDQKTLNDLIARLDSEVDIEQTIIWFRQNFSDGTTAYVKKLYIASDHRTKGLGTQFLQFVFEELHYSKIYSDVYAKNTVALNIFAKCGAKELGRFWQKYTDSCVFFELDHVDFKAYVDKKRSVQ